MIPYGLPLIYSTFACDAVRAKRMLLDFCHAIMIAFNRCAFPEGASAQTSPTQFTEPTFRELPYGNGCRTVPFSRQYRTKNHICPQTCCRQNVCRSNPTELRTKRANLEDHDA